MTYDVYRYIFYGGAALAGLCLVIAALLFVFLKIPSVIGDLSGATARKGVEAIRRQNEVGGSRMHGSSQVNRERGKITDKINATGTLVISKDQDQAGASPTTKIGTQQLAEEAQQAYKNSASTEDDGATTVLLDNDDQGATTVLDQTTGEPIVAGDVPFTIEYEITFIHTDELIG